MFGKSFHDFIVPLLRTLAFAFLAIGLLWLLNEARGQYLTGAPWDWIAYFSPESIAAADDNINKWLKLQGLSAWVMAALYVLALLYFIEQTGGLKYLVDLAWPSPPPFLTQVSTKDPASAWHPANPLIGRTAELKSLSDFALGRRHKRCLSCHGLYGRSGVGKTRLAVEWLRMLKKRQWHVGELNRAIPDDWIFRRNTAILVNYGKHAQDFWDSFDTLRLAQQRHRIRVLFESSMDLKLMAAGVPAADFEDLKDLLWQVGDLDTTRARVNERMGHIDRSTQAQSDVSTSSVSMPSPLVPEEAERSLPAEPPGQSTFLRVLPLLPADMEGVITARAAYRNLRTRIGPHREAIIAVARGRPQCAIDLCDRLARVPSGQSAPGFDTYTVARTEALKLLSEAQTLFPENGLQYLALAALGHRVDIPASLRLSRAGAAPDILKLITLFRDQAESDEYDYAWAKDPRAYFPSIDDEDVARLVLFMTLERLQAPDVSSFAENLFDRRQAREAIKPFCEAVVRLSARPEGQAATALLFLMPLVAIEEKRRDELIRQVSEYLNGEAVGFRMPVERLINSMQGVIELMRVASRANFAVFQNDVSALGGLTEAFVYLISRLQAPHLRRRLLLDYARLASSEGSGAEIRIIADDPDWCRSPFLDNLLGMVFGLSDDAPYKGFDWLNFERLFPADALINQTSDEARERSQGEADTLEAFNLMDVYFRSSQNTGREMSADDSAKLVARLTDTGNPVGVLGASWAIYWYGNPTSITMEVEWPEALIEAMITFVNNDKIDPTLRKRCIAALAHYSLGPIKDDIIYDWAVWADSGGRGDRPKTYPLNPRLPFERLKPVLTQARIWLNDPGQSKNLRRAAALLWLPYGADDPLVLNALADVTTDRQLNLTQRRTFLYRLYQARNDTSTTLYDALIRLLRERDPDAGYDAFLALAALDRLHDVKPDDLEGYTDSSLFLETWHNFNQRHVSPPDTSLPDAEDKPVPGQGRATLIDRHISQNGHNIHKLKAKDTTGRWAYYFVLVPPHREAEFLKAIEGDGTIDLEDYGTVIASSYGETPSDEIRQYLKDKYGFEV